MSAHCHACPAPPLASELSESSEEWKGMALRCVITVVFAGLGWLMQSYSATVSLICYLLAYVAGAWDLAKTVWEDLKSRTFDTHFLMFLVVPSTAILGAWGEGALLLVLFSLSAALESYALGRTHRAIKALLHGVPKTALKVLPDGSVEELAIDKVVKGDRVRVLPGQQIPVDFQILSGETTCNESSLTGESLPVSKGPGDTALSGTLNEGGVIEGKSLADAAGSTLQRTINLIGQAQQMRSPSQRLAEKFGSKYTLFVLAACSILFLYAWRVDGWPAFIAGEEGKSAFYRAMNLLVVMSPCALVISVPAAILSAIAAGARSGILFRGGQAVERLHEVTVVAMDKTGTLTEGKLQFSHSDVLSGTEEELMSYGSALARVSTHPASKALAAAALRKGLDEREAEQVTQVPGKGLEAMVDGAKIRLGNRPWVAEWSGEAALATTALPEPGVSEVWITGTLSDGKPLLGRTLFTDRLREESPRILSQLHASGRKSIMLTGDRPEAASLMAQKAGVGEIKAGLTPVGKVEALQALKAQGAVVAMVGDGVNDAPSLAAADVSIAMGLAGSDAAIEQADLVLTDDRLEKLITAFDLSRRVHRIMTQNIVLALGTMLFMAITVCFKNHLHLAFGVAMHEGSTVAVVLNGLRLLTKRS